MIEDAKEDEVNLLVVSGYRSFETQKSLKSAYSVNYGKGANTFSADQGFSEHQLGTTVDLTTKELGQNFSSFEKTKAYIWLTENAYKYGFTLSYPKGNAFYIFEPWHWRFVGLDLARTLQKEKKTFYDLDQREIDTYLVDIFD
jgi:D-alanyl-D-alanine carboxypeptidase